jgi:hypothetical protein
MIDSPKRRSYLARVGAFLIILALIAGMIGCDGNGSDPYADYIKIYDWTDLDDIRNNLVAKYILMNDLDSTTAGYEELAGPTANEGKGWQPIGTDNDPFTGAFDGQAYEIRDLYSDRRDEIHGGLLGYVDDGGIIENLGVANANVMTGGLVGGLVGWNWGTVSNCHSTGNITGYWSVAGGLIGENGGTVRNCYSAGNVTSVDNVGGLVGWNTGTVSDSYSTANVSGYSPSFSFYIGGLVGYNTGPVRNSYSTGNVTGNYTAGGLVGLGSEVNVSSSFWDTETSGQSASDGGTGMNTSQMQDITTFSSAGWDIIAVDNPDTRNPASIWNIVDAVTYPFLSWQP